MISLFEPLKLENLTYLKIRYNWKENEVSLEAGRSWDENIDFSNYNKSFYIQSIMTRNGKVLNHNEVLSLFAKYELSEYLDSVINLVRKGKHFGMDLYYFKRYDIKFIGNLHSINRGINNKYHAILAGGIRRHEPDEAEIEVVKDGLNLSRAMSYKNIAADLPFGGSKTTVIMETLDLSNFDMLGFLAYSIDSIRTMTGPDMKFPTEMADVMNEHFSMQFTGGPSSILGETGKPTAYGTFLALKEVMQYKYNTKSLKGKKIAVQGLGAVGWWMAKYLLEEDIELLISDIDENRAIELIKSNPNRAITFVNPNEILYSDVDILVPCAMGGIITSENIDSLKCKIIFGAANNQLQAVSPEEEIELSRKLHEKGILYQESWWHNCAGVMAGAEEYIHRNNATYERLVKNIEIIIPYNTRKNLLESEKNGITPTENMYRICEKILYKENDLKGVTL